ncbi:MAG: hypothetical protein Q4D91_05875 [Lautropia sp.]|nr:hypothetical protein [Lautropia sp.]
MNASSFHAAHLLPPQATIDPNALPYAVLEHLGVVRVAGKDAASFLQAQLTQDILPLQNGQARLAGYCTPKGRLLATFWVIRQDMPGASPTTAAPQTGTADASTDTPASAPDDALPTFWLVCARDIAASITKRLSMYVLRAKVKVEDASAHYLLLGFFGQIDEALRPLGATIGHGAAAPLPTVQLTETTTDLLTTPARQYLGPERQLFRSLLIIPPEQVANRTGDDGVIHYRFSANDWLQLAVASGVPWISAPSQELFVPQMVNLDLTDGISFKKGCYPGQEIVARSKYLGKQKRRMFAGLCSGQLPLPGTDILAYDGTPIGIVVLAASLAVHGEHPPAPPETEDGPAPTETELLTVACKRYLVLFEARIDAVGAQPKSAGMIATSLLIGEAAIGLLQQPYPMPDI